MSTVFLFSCESEGKIEFSKSSKQFFFENADIKFEFDNQMRCNVYRKSNDQLLSIVSQEAPPHFVVINGMQIKQFIVDLEKVEVSPIHTNSGKGKRLQIMGVSEGPLGSVIEKTLFVDMYDKFPGTGLVNVQYKNVNSTPGLYIEKEVNNSFKLDASLLNSNYNRHSFWILQGGSYKSRPDWILPVTDTLSFENFMGKDETTGNSGGGLPVLDVWNKEGGFFYRKYTG